MHNYLDLRDIQISLPKEKETLIGFLSRFDLVLDEDIEESIGFFDKDKLVATCSYSGKVLKCFAVDENYRGINISTGLVSEMNKRLAQKGIYKTFIFTREENRNIFENIGYKYLATGKSVVLLENGIDCISDFQQELKKHISQDTLNGCIIMNCNPFTLGHKYLISTTSKLCDRLYIFIVEEDKSLFPFKWRKKLVVEGTKDIQNAVILDGGDYIISSATFPGYFIKRMDEKTQAEALLDIDIFSRYIAPILNIRKRFAGSEPYDPMTATYNKVMREVLPKKGIDFVEIPRIKVEGTVVSASRARECIKNNDKKTLRELLPATTLDFLDTHEGRSIIAKIKGYSND